jgi:hypothetical protein
MTARPRTKTGQLFNGHLHKKLSAFCDLINTVTLREIKGHFQDESQETPRSKKHLPSLEEAFKRCKKMAGAGKWADSASRQAVVSELQKKHFSDEAKNCPRPPGAVKRP